MKTKVGHSLTSLWPQFKAAHQSSLFQQHFLKEKKMELAVLGIFNEAS